MTDAGAPNTEHALSHGAVAAVAPLAEPAPSSSVAFGVSLACASALHAAVLGLFLVGSIPLGAGGRVPQAIEVTVVDAAVLESLAREETTSAQATQVPQEQGNAPLTTAANRPAPQPTTEDRRAAEAVAQPPETPPAEQPVTEAPAPPPAPPVVTASEPTPEAVPPPPEPQQVASVIEPKPELSTQPAAPPPKPPEPRTEPGRKPEPKETRQPRPEEREAAKPSTKPPSQPLKKGANAARATEPSDSKNGRATATPGEANQYAIRVRARIASNRPEGLNARGTTVVTFALSSTGGLTSVAVSLSSGNLTLDQAALQAVRNAAPFPLPPSGMSKGQLTFSISFVFQ